jgi:hypothetical protein
MSSRASPIMPWRALRTENVMDGGERGRILDGGKRKRTGEDRMEDI